MKRVKAISKSLPAQASIFGWYSDMKTLGKQNYVNNLWNSHDSLDPNDIDDMPLF